MAHIHMTALAELRREKARRGDGRFGAQVRTESDVSLAAPIDAEPEVQESPWANARREYLSMKETNKRMRKTLAEKFPGVKFSVRGSSYAGGSSTRVTWVDGPKRRDVEDALNKYVASRPDAYNSDYWDPVSSREYDEDGNPVIYNYSSDHVFADREYSPETEEAARELVDSALAAEGHERDQYSRYDIPQAIFKYATIENGGRDKHGYPDIHGDWNGVYVGTLDRVAKEMIANEAYNRQLAQTS